MAHLSGTGASLADGAPHRGDRARRKNVPTNFPIVRAGELAARLEKLDGREEKLAPSSEKRSTYVAKISAAVAYAGERGAAQGIGCATNQLQKASFAMRSAERTPWPEPQKTVEPPQSSPPGQ